MRRLFNPADCSGGATEVHFSPHSLQERRKQQTTCVNTLLRGMARPTHFCLHCFGSAALAAAAVYCWLALHLALQLLIAPIASQHKQQLVWILKMLLDVSFC
jgi:hypothetical protein